MQTTDTKRCSRCSEVKDTSEFYSARTKDGFQSQCKGCVSEGKKAHYSANREKCLAKSRAYYLANTEACVSRAKTYREANLESVQEKSTRRARTKGWATTLLCSARKRAKKQGYDFDLDVDWIKALFERQNGLCFWYGVELSPRDERRNPLQPSIDRIDCNRGYTKDNIVISCAAANMGRSDTDPEVFWRFCNQLRESFRRQSSPSPGPEPLGT